MMFKSVQMVRVGANGGAVLLVVMPESTSYGLGLNKMGMFNNKYRG